MNTRLAASLVSVLLFAPLVSHAESESAPVALAQRADHDDASMVKGLASAKIAAQDKGDAMRNMRYLDNPPGGIDMWKIDNARKPDSVLFEHTIDVRR